MVTGDNIMTAVAIAKECGILPKDYDYETAAPNDFRAMEGKRFREIVGGTITDSLGKVRVKNDRVFF